MSDVVRCFVALALPEELLEPVVAFFSGEGGRIDGVRWAPATQVHLTLKFLGNVVAGQVPAVTAALEASVASQGPFALELRGAGAFPTELRPRVIWVGVSTGAAETTALAASLERELALLGFAAEARAFTPHLTVGRVKAPPRDRGAIPRLVASLRDHAWGTAVVPAVHLLRSELFPAGPIYSILHATPLPEPPRQQR